MLLGHFDKCRLLLLKLPLHQLTSHVAGRCKTSLGGFSSVLYQPSSGYNWKSPSRPALWHAFQLGVSNLDCPWVQKDPLCDQCQYKVLYPLQHRTKKAANMHSIPASGEPDSGIKWTHSQSNLKGTLPTSDENIDKVSQSVSSSVRKIAIDSSKVGAVPLGVWP